jgi:tRNA A-37 threonylcarbamoyl transferase component Bud32
LSIESEYGALSLEKIGDLVPTASKVAVCQYGPSVYAKPGSFREVDLLVICDAYAEGLRAHIRMQDGRAIRFLIAERTLIESDVKKGALGDFLTEKLLYPFRSIENNSYLQELSLAAKTRAVKEEVRDLVLEYGEMCRGLVAEPEFFALSKLRKRARIFIPSMSDYLKLLDPAVKNHNISNLRGSFAKAISEMHDLVELEGNNVTIIDSAVDRWLRDRSSEQVVNILRESQRAFYSYLTRSRAIYLNLDLLARELYSPLRFGLDPALAGKQPDDPKNHLFLRTETGMVPLNARFSFEDIANKLRPGRPVTMSPLAGVLNEVFLLTAGNERFVAKKFTDWHGFKWFTLNLVSFGSKFFAVSGKARMSNEYGINSYLAKKGLNVPKIIYASLKQRTLVENYISGIPLNRLVTQAIGQSMLTKQQYQLAQELGEALGRIHEVGVSLGDSKPENFIAKDGEIFTIDLEQAGRRGDSAWDIAVLLFYIGHYSTSPVPTRGLTELVETIIQGYMRKGRADELKRAAGVRYARVFSMWTSAPIILEITKMLRAPSAER